MAARAHWFEGDDAGGGRAEARRTDEEAHHD